MSEERSVTAAVEPTETPSTTSVTISTTTSTNVVATTKPVEPVEPRLKLSDVVPDKKSATALADLLSMFDHCRPHDTKATLDFGVKWLKPLGAKMDERGNWTLRIGPAVGEPGASLVLWSSHIDTVDWHEGPKKVVLSHTTGVLKLSDKDVNSSCLGADCTTGVWIMREMVKAKVPGLYIWHEAEEAGGQGSSWIAKNTPELLKGMQAAIAFDRKGFDNIITNQSGGMCCSDAFAKALAKQLPETGFKPDPTGTFTVSANYTDVIPECTNLSVGYFGQHFKTETQNAIFAMLMRAKMIRFDEAKLVIKRKPGEGKHTYGGYYGMGYTGGGGYGLNDWREDGYSTGGYREPPRTYVLTGDKVRILQSAVKSDLAEQQDVGKEGYIKAIRYGNGRDTHKNFDVRLTSGELLEGLEDRHVERVVLDKYAPVAKAPARFNIGDRVRVRESARPELSQRRLKHPLCNIVGKEGEVSGIGLRSDWTDVKMDSGQMLFSLKSSDLERIADKMAHGKVTPINKPKDYSKTKCGGLCGGRCKGLCASMKKPDVMAKEALEPMLALTIRDFVLTYPDQVADLIEQWGLGVDDLYENYPDCM